MEVEIRHANPQDMGHILRLIKELALFEKELDQVDINLKDLLNDGFNDPKDLLVSWLKMGQIL